LRVSGGGRHEGIGTHNRIVSLGGADLEILAIADADEAARSERAGVEAGPPR
jgi:Glyoxalase-like domain